MRKLRAFSSLLSIILYYIILFLHVGQKNKSSANTKGKYLLKARQIFEKQKRDSAFISRSPYNLMVTGAGFLFSFLSCFFPFSLFQEMQQG